MRILVIGSGAREHALLRALSADPAVTNLHIAPGNAGTGSLATSYPVDMASPESITALAKELSVDLVVVGPEGPLVAGAADSLRLAGIATFGPSAAAAQIEGSKAFAKEVMVAAGVPTAASVSVSHPTQIDEALDTCGSPYVVKDDGLAAGKGVVVTTDRKAAVAHAEAVLAGGHHVLIEAFLSGPEVSLFAICDGTRAVPLLPAQDFKRLGDDDTGPNTGGMGAYAPLPWVPDGLVERVQREVLNPVVAEMAARGTPFVGLLYAGLALTPRGPEVIEFNCRFGDPETQVVLELLASPLAAVLKAAADGDLSEYRALKWKAGSAVTVVIAAENYPQAPTLGDAVYGANHPDVLHAGTADTGEGTIISTGGRVLSVLGTGEDLRAAREAAYKVVKQITMRGSQHRTDIGEAAIQGRVIL
ncbi:phosphoribosylamine--glycine ligase [Nakamurella antarctica]|uniref:Phosphoribosylamine--glycine ligase n=1 Tax=Nakamurella antarctica TaxID=1902245 RepID=A0A3G8ZZW2_9ACTN|nr:phosphoribosylamine--glycine ligase [Nakamurella antarctica]AZI59081.1 phosphoribosylamine--glycine ligase [Nakamurella antarctica]